MYLWENKKRPGKSRSFSWRRARDFFFCGKSQPVGHYPLSLRRAQIQMSAGGWNMPLAYSQEPPFKSLEENKNTGTNCSGVFWRRTRDLNPRDAFAPYSLSRGWQSSWISCGKDTVSGNKVGIKLQYTQLSVILITNRTSSKIAFILQRIQLNDIITLLIQGGYTHWNAPYQHWRFIPR